MLSAMTLRPPVFLDGHQAANLSPLFFHGGLAQKLLEGMSASLGLPVLLFLAGPRERNLASWQPPADLNPTCDRSSACSSLLATPAHSASLLSSVDCTRPSLTALPQLPSHLADLTFIGLPLSPPGPLRELMVLCSHHLG